MPCARPPWRAQSPAVERVMVELWRRAPDGGRQGRWKVVHRRWLPEVMAHVATRPQTPSWARRSRYDSRRCLCRPVGVGRHGVLLQLVGCCRLARSRHPGGRRRSEAARDSALRSRDGSSHGHCEHDLVPGGGQRVAPEHWPWSRACQRLSGRLHRPRAIGPADHHAIQWHSPALGRQLGQHPLQRRARVVDGRNRISRL